MIEEAKGLANRCMTFFGRKEGQTLLEFKQEFDKLTLTDKRYLVDEFNKAGMPTLPTVG